MEIRLQRRDALLPVEDAEEFRQVVKSQLKLELKHKKGLIPNVISVKLPTYDVINVCLSIVPGFLVLNLKTFINEAMLQRGFIGINPERMRLLYADKELLDETEVLDCHIDGKHTLDIVLRMQPLSEEGTHDSQPAEADRMSTLNGYGDDKGEGPAPAPAFTAHNYEYREFLRTSVPEHNAENVPLNTQIKLVFGPNPMGVHLVLPAMLEASGWEHYLQSLGGLARPPADAEPRSHARPSTSESTSPHKSKEAAEPIAPALEQPGDMLRHYGGDVEAARARGFVRWTPEKLARRVFVVEAAQDIYDRVPTMRRGINESLLDAMLSTGKTSTSGDKGDERAGGETGSAKAAAKSPAEEKDSVKPQVGLAEDEVSVTGSVAASVAASVATKSSFNPASSTAGLDAAALATLKEKRAHAAARDGALDEIRYSWKGINRGYLGGDACSWQRYTHEVPVDMRIEVRAHKSAHEAAIAAPTEVPLLQHIFNYQPPAQAIFDSYSYAFKAPDQSEDTVPTVLLLPPVRHPGNVPTKDEVLGLRLGQREEVQVPRWPSHMEQPLVSGQASADTAGHWLRTFSALDDDRTYELVLTPAEPLKYDTEYFIVLANGVPVLPAGDVLSATYGFAAAGQICEDRIIRFRTVASPPPLSRKEAKLLRKDLRQKAIVNMKPPLKAPRAWVDLKTIDWEVLNAWPKPPSHEIEDSDAASEYADEFEEEEEEEKEEDPEAYKTSIMQSLDTKTETEADVDV